MLALRQTAYAPSPVRGLTFRAHSYNHTCWHIVQSAAKHTNTHAHNCNILSHVLYTQSNWITQLGSCSCAGWCWRLSCDDACVIFRARMTFSSHSEEMGERGQRTVIRLVRIWRANIQRVSDSDVVPYAIHTIHIAPTLALNSTPPLRLWLRRRYTPRHGHAGQIPFGLSTEQLSWVLIVCSGSVGKQQHKNSGDIRYVLACKLMLMGRE